MAAIKRILFVGDLNFYAKGASRLKAMEDLGIRVIGLPHTAQGDPATGAPGLSFYERLAWKLGVHIDSGQVNRKIPAIAALEKPDLLWIEKGNMISRATLKAVRDRSPGTKIIGYSDDDMFNPLNHTRAYVRTLPHYDLVFTTKSYNAHADELPALGAKRVVMVDKAYDPDQHKLLPLTAAERAELAADVSFIGSYAPERGEVLNFLAANGISVVVWGNGWGRFTAASPRLTIKNQALVNSPENLRFTKAINASRINLGFLRKVNRDLQTDRSIEIPASGGFLLAERSPEHERLFEDGREAVYFDSNAELLDKIRHYLAHEDTRAAIATAGHARSRASGYSHRDRMAEMLAVCWGLQK
ncbi:MAG: glycosyltransferase [Rhodospirillales bacterium]|nr:glycosyltransferase [Rhodospirillales bacterium]